MKMTITEIEAKMNEIRELRSHERRRLQTGHWAGDLNNLRSLSNDFHTLYKQWAEMKAAS